jgi:hypothetical protein
MIISYIDFGVPGGGRWGLTIVGDDCCCCCCDVLDSGRDDGGGCMGKPGGSGADAIFLYFGGYTLIITIKNI